MGIETAAASGIDSLINGQGSIVSVLVIVLLGVCFVCWHQLKTSSAEKEELNAYNRSLTDRLFTVIQDNGKVIYELKEAIKNVQSK